MILFVGCSYTWGAGLQFEYLSKERGWTSDKINAINPPKSHLEHLDYKCDEYRKKHHFPNLVAKKMNMAYGLGKLGNGGNNYEIAKILEHAGLELSGPEPVELVVIQFTDWTRSCPEIYNRADSDGTDNTDFLSNDHIKKIIRTQIDNIKFGCEQHLKSNWIGWSWRNDLAQVLKTKYPKNFLPLYHKGKEYDSMEELIVVGVDWRFDDSSFQHKDNLRICDVIQGVDDTHLSSTGHKLIANSIVRRLK
tara:strand:- start:4850 stop:5596 length:747 start_codon:yes stop_codon:yes gene_type:complete